MICLLGHRIVAFLLDLITVPRPSDRNNDSAMLLVRPHLRILQRTHPHPPRISRWEHRPRRVLASTRTTMTTSSCLQPGTLWVQIGVLFNPETLLHWHRERVRRT